MTGGYVGRFAPSPTGPLHFGSLAAAVASYLEARRHDGRWLLRIENIDPPREADGAADAILRSLDTHGFEWSGETIWQADSLEAHLAAIETLRAQHRVYRCTCSRKDLTGEPSSPLGTIYPGTCRAGCGDGDAALRLRTTDESICFDDRLQGRYCQRLESESGDFIVRRRDGLIAYHLAVVVDDAIQGVTDVVRGIDLIDSTPRQIWLQRCLGIAEPGYAHVPVLVHPDGDKLSKLTGAPALDDNRAGRNLFDVLVVLMQRPPAELETAPIQTIWQWASENWDPGRLFGNKSIFYHS